jgi:hypothetical protein
MAPMSLRAVPARAAFVAIAIVVLDAACGGQVRSAPPAPATTAPTPVATASGPETTQTPVPTGTGSASPTIEPTPLGVVRLPRGAPRTYTADVDAADLPLERLAPKGATVGATWRGSVRGGGAAAGAVAFAWSLGADPAAQESGLEVWQRVDDPVRPWRAAFAFTDPASSGVLGVRFDAGDLTRDGSPDLLTFEGLGGSGACGVWRVVRMRAGSFAEIYREQTCDTDVRIAGGDLAIRRAVFAPGDAHCCPTAYRITTLRWDGTRWRVVDRTTVRT